MSEGHFTVFTRSDFQNERKSDRVIGLSDLENLDTKTRSEFCEEKCVYSRVPHKRNCFKKLKPLNSEEYKTRNTLF